MANDPSTSSGPIIGPTGTRIYSDGRYTTVRFRDTDVVRIAYTDVRLDSGGSRDVVMRARLNQASRQFELGYHVMVKEGVWVVQTSRDVYRFVDGMHLLRSPGHDHEYVRYETEPTQEATP
jgi:hypothetical protein